MGLADANLSETVHCRGLQLWCLFCSVAQTSSPSSLDPWIRRIITIAPRKHALVDDGVRKSLHIHPRGRSTVREKGGHQAGLVCGRSLSIDHASQGANHILTPAPDFASCGAH